jgi:hypothetical protein
MSQESNAAANLLLDLLARTAETGLGKEKQKWVHQQTD